jgi:hypothetical protein
MCHPLILSLAKRFSTFISGVAVSSTEAVWRLVSRNSTLQATHAFELPGALSVNLYFSASVSWLLRLTNLSTSIRKAVLPLFSGATRRATFKRIRAPFRLVIMSDVAPWWPRCLSQLSLGRMSSRGLHFESLFPQTTDKMPQIPSFFVKHLLTSVPCQTCLVSLPSSFSPVKDADFTAIQHLEQIIERTQTSFTMLLRHNSVCT